MRKTANTAIFIILATIFNLIIMLVLLIGSFLIANKLFSNSSNEMAGIIGFFIIGIPIIITFIVYNFLIRKIQKRWNINQYLKPLFQRRRK